MDARETALLTLNACERQGGWSDGALKKQISAAGLDSRDAALATQLCAGVLQNQMLLDFYLAHFSNIPLKRMEGRVVQALRLGAYQMLFLDRIPHSAAVNRSVELTRAYCKNPRAAGMVNGILRSLERSLERLPTIPQRDPVEYLSILYSHPAWMVREFLLTLGNDGAAALLRANNAQPATAAQVNTLKINARELRLRLEERGVRAEEHPWLTDCILLSGTGNLEELPEFQAGLFYIQDPASRLAVAAAGPAAGMRVLDACAAPGGKSFAAAIAMGGRGTVCSCDLHPHKKKLIANGAARLGLDCVTPMTADACVHRPEWEGALIWCLWTPPVPVWASFGRSRTSATRTRSPWQPFPAYSAESWRTSPPMCGPAGHCSTPPARCCGGKMRMWCPLSWRRTPSLDPSPSSCLAFPERRGAAGC